MVWGSYYNGRLVLMSSSPPLPPPLSSSCVRPEKPSRVFGSPQGGSKWGKNLKIRWILKKTNPILGFWDMRKINFGSFTKKKLFFSTTIWIFELSTNFNSVVLVCTTNLNESVLKWILYWPWFRTNYSRSRKYLEIWFLYFLISWKYWKLYFFQFSHILEILEIGFFWLPGILEILEIWFF